MPFVELPILDGKTLPAFPCHIGTKKPFTEHGFKNATTDKARFSRLVRNQPFLYGIPTGSIVGFDILDIDPEAFEWEKQQNFPATRTHKTPRGGTHYFFIHHSGLKNSASKIITGVDVRSDGGYIIWWPKERLDLTDAPITPWPDDLLQRALSISFSERTERAQTWSPFMPDSSDRLTANECFAILAPDDSDEKVIQELYLSMLNATLALGVTIDVASVFYIQRYSNESRFAITAAAKAMIRIGRTEIKARNNTLNAEAYSLGRILARNWTPPRYILRALWRGAEKCRLVHEDGTQVIINTILSGLLAGVKRPYPNLSLQDFGAKK